MTAHDAFVRALLELEATSFRHLLSRVTTLLLERVEGNSIESLTHKEIAEQLRVYRESITAALSALRKAGIIVLERKRIRVRNRARLELASFE